MAHLAQRGAHVYLCARSPTKGTAAISQIKALHPQARVSLLEMDHLSLSSVAAAAKLFLSMETALHGLINNAGIMATPFEMTKDGYEAQWQTNYLAHWVFTSHLLPLMISTAKNLPPGGVRIVNLSSSGHYSAPKGGINFNDLSLQSDTPRSRYAQSKLANILHAKTLNKRYGPGMSTSQTDKGEIWVSIVHPGLVKTQLGDNAQFPRLVKMAFSIYKSLGGGFDGDKGSWTSLYCAASQDMKREQSGTYFQRIAERGFQSSTGDDMELAARLEEWTESEMEKHGWID